MTHHARFGLLVAIAALVAACGGNPRSAATVIGPQGGSVATESGVTLRVAPGALASATQVTVSEAAPRAGALRRIEVEPRGMVLAAPALISVKVEGDSTTMKLVEIEHAAEGEVEHAIETERHNGRDNARQAEIEHLGTFEVRGAASCDVACDAGFECDDGACKPHDEVEAPDDDGVDDPATHDVGDDNGVDDPATHDVGDDHGVDPSTGGGPAVCPDGMELDASDGTCKPHGGGVEDPAPAPAPDPTVCPDGMELDASDGTCKPHGGGVADPAPAPAPDPTVCPDGMELDASDGTCKPHGGGVEDPAPAPAPDPTVCPDGMELDASDGTCKPHGGSGGGKTGP